MLRLNRRQLTGSFLAGAAMAASPAPASAQAPTSESPDQLLAAAKRNVESNRATLAKFQLPMAVEPAASFKAL